MPNKSAFSNLILAWFSVPSLILLLCAGSATAQISSVNYTLAIGSGFLCDPGDSVSCPAIAKSANGDSYEISGAGMFDAHNKAVQATGTYAHKSPSGNVLDRGVWIANNLVSFDSYGAAPNALLHQTAPLGPVLLGPKRTPMALGPMPTGGVAVLRIQLLSVLGRSTTAVLQLNCALGNFPPERSVDGVRLTLGADNTEFSEEESGRVMFLAVRLGAPGSRPSFGR
jgi:hypothetical protein